MSNTYKSFQYIGMIPNVLFGEQLLSSCLIGFLFLINQSHDCEPHLMCKQMEGRQGSEVRRPKTFLPGNPTSDMAPQYHSSLPLAPIVDPVVSFVSIIVFM